MLKNYLYLHMGEIVKACGRNVMTTAYHIGYIKMIHLILIYLFVLTSPSNRLFFFWFYAMLISKVGSNSSRNMQQALRS